MMKKPMVKSASVRVSDGWALSIPLVVGEVCLSSPNGGECYVTLAEADGMAEFYRTEESIQSALVEMEDESLLDRLYARNCLLAAGEYEDVFTHPDERWQQVFRYLIYLVRCERGEEERFLSDTVGKPLEKDRIPPSDVERAFLGPKRSSLL